MIERIKRVKAGEGVQAFYKEALTTLGEISKRYEAAGVGITTNEIIAVLGKALGRCVGSVYRDEVEDARAVVNKNFEEGFEEMGSGQPR